MTPVTKDASHPVKLFKTEKAWADWLEKNAFEVEYKEVNSDHGGMVRLVLPDVFDFFDRVRP